MCGTGTTVRRALRDERLLLEIVARVGMILGWEPSLDLVQ
jgi:hypothetical protein